MAFDPTIIDTHVGIPPEEKAFLKKLIKDIYLGASGANGIVYDTRTGGIQREDQPAGGIAWNVDTYSMLFINQPAAAQILVTTVGTPLVGLPYVVRVVDGDAPATNYVDLAAMFPDGFTMGGSSSPAHGSSSIIMFDGNGWFIVGS